MATESDYPVFHLRLQYGPRGDVRWLMYEGSQPFDPGRPGDWGGWCDPDEVWREVRQDLPVAIATWNHRVRRHQAALDADEHTLGRRTDVP